MYDRAIGLFSDHVSWFENKHFDLQEDGGTAYFTYVFVAELP